MIAEVLVKLKYISNHLFHYSRSKCTSSSFLSQQQMQLIKWHKQQSQSERYLL